MPDNKFFSLLTGSEDKSRVLNSCTTHSQMEDTMSFTYNPRGVNGCRCRIDVLDCGRTARIRVSLFGCYLSFNGVLSNPLHQGRQA
jgi:hypothetical protein